MKYINQLITAKMLAYSRLSLIKKKILRNFLNIAIIEHHQTRMLLLEIEIY